jgi:diguanylate cyclase (GGDEF)-like protein
MGSVGRKSKGKDSNSLHVLALFVQRHETGRLGNETKYNIGHCKVNLFSFISFYCIIGVVRMITNPPHPAILLADPEESLCASARRVFERRGYQVTVVQDGESALAFFDPKFHVAIVSVTLEKYDGLSVLRDIRSRAPGTQVILLTDASTVSAAMMGLKEGAYAYILKPISDYLQLTHAVERALELYDLRKLNEVAVSSPISRVTLADATVPVQNSSPNPTPNLIQSPILNSSLDQAELTTRALRELVELGRESQPKMLKSAARSVARIFGAKHATIFLLGDDRPLIPVASAGEGDPNTTQEFDGLVDEEFALRIAREAKTLLNFSTGKKQFRVGAPLLVNNQVFGVLVIYPLPEGAITPERLAWLEAYSGQIAMSVELVRLREENSRLLPSDPLTGALREDYFLQIAEREFRRSWRFNESLSVIHVVLDNLDVLNDREKSLGDRALRMVADACRQAVRNIDLVSFGSQNSFLVLLLMTDSQDVQIVAERILNGVQASALDDAGEKIWLSVKLGVATYPHEGCTSILDLLEIVRSAHTKVRLNGQKIARA